MLGVEQVTVEGFGFEDGQDEEDLEVLGRRGASDPRSAGPVLAV